MRASRSKSATNSPSGSAIQSGTVTTTCASGLRRRLGEQPRRAGVCSSQAPLARDAPFVVAKRAGEKARLREQPLGAAILDVAAAERLGDQLLEPLDVLRLAPQLIVEAQHLGDEAWADRGTAASTAIAAASRAAACAMASRSNGVSRAAASASRACSSS